MLQLYIDGRPVRLTPAFSATLTLTNPLLSDSGDRTLEITLPLDEPRNRDIFGPLHRPETATATHLKPLPFTLDAPPLRLTGSAHITSITEREARVQLKAAAADLTALATIDGQDSEDYIDELTDLGTVFDEADLESETRGRYALQWDDDAYRDPERPGMYLCRGIDSPADLAAYFLHVADDTHRQHGTPDETTCTFFPIRSTRQIAPPLPTYTVPSGKGDYILGVEAAYFPANAHIYGTVAQAYGPDYAGPQTPEADRDAQGRERSAYRLDPVMLTETIDYCNTHPLGEFTAGGGLAPQPRLTEVVRRVLRHYGYTYRPPSRATDAQRLTLAQCTIASPRCTVHYAEMLPHWRVSEFLRQVQAFTGSVLVLDAAAKTATLQPVDQFYRSEAQRVTLHDAPSHTAETQDESQSQGTTSLTGNVDYQWPADDPILRLPDEVWTKAHIQSVSSPDSAREAWTALSMAERARSHTLYTISARRADGLTLYRQAYASLQSTRDLGSYPGLDSDTAGFALCQVDYYPPLMREPDHPDTITRLSIVPARMEIEIPGAELATPPAPGYYNAAHYIPRLISAAPYGAPDTGYSVNSAVNPQSPAAQDLAEQQSQSAERPPAIEVFAHLPGVRSTQSYAFHTGAGAPGQLTAPVPYGVTLISHRPAMMTAVGSQSGAYVPPEGLPANLPELGYISGVPMAGKGQCPPGPYPLFPLSLALYGSVPHFLPTASLTETVNTRARHTWRLTLAPSGWSPLTLTAPLLLRSRLWCIADLELTLTPRGASPLITAHLHEITLAR